MHWKICPVTGKRGYTSKAKARKTAGGMKERLRLYFCDHCKAWHLTKHDGTYQRRKGYTKKPSKVKAGYSKRLRGPRADMAKVEEAIAKKEAAKK